MLHARQPIITQIYALIDAQMGRRAREERLRMNVQFYIKRRVASALRRYAAINRR